MKILMRLRSDVCGGQWQGLRKELRPSDRDAYDQRVQDIYLPKAEFLRDALTEKVSIPAR